MCISRSQVTSIYRSRRRIIANSWSNRDLKCYVRPISLFVCLFVCFPCFIFILFVSYFPSTSTYTFHFYVVRSFVSFATYSLLFVCFSLSMFSSSRLKPIPIHARLYYAYIAILLCWTVGYKFSDFIYIYI